MGCFKVSVLLEELRYFELEKYESLKRVWINAIDGKLSVEDSKKTSPISIDYAVMERSKKIKVLPGAFEWSDLGSFESIYNYLKPIGHPVDDMGNMSIGSKPYTAFIRVKNTIFVHTNDANLILQKRECSGCKEFI